MSIRTLIEFNSDRGDLGLDELSAINQYLRSGGAEAKERLEDMGIRAVAERHHADDYRIPEGAWGFGS